jgi:hypothetical protein
MSPPLPVVAMLPVDATGLPRQHQLPTALPDWRATPCPGCTRPAWRSPDQVRIRGALMLCYFCVQVLLTSGEYSLGAVVNLADPIEGGHR